MRSLHRYQFTGREHDSHTDYNYHRARWYDPTTGRWLSEDPIRLGGGDVNLSRYVGNGPTNGVDPSGLEEEEDGPTRAFNREEVGHAVPAEMRGRILQDIEVTGKAADLAYKAVANSPQNQLESAFAPLLDTVTVYKNVCSYETIARLEKAYIVAATPFATMFGVRDVDDAFHDDASVDGHRQSGLERTLKFAGGVGAIGVAGFGAAGRAVAPVTRTTRFIDNVTVVDRPTGRTLTGIVDVGPTIDRIRSGGSFPHRNDGCIYQNRPLPGKTIPELPTKPAGYYREYVHPTPGINGPGPQRIVVGQGGEMYYTPDHYSTFIPLTQ